MVAFRVVMRRWLPVLVAVVAVACGATPTPAHPLDDTGKRLALITRFGEPNFCDPYRYPVGRIEPQAQRNAELAQIRYEHPSELEQLEQYFHIDPGAPGADQQLLIRVRELEVIQLDASTGDFRIATASQTVTGRISNYGEITVTNTGEGVPPMCPICLAETTLIGTPAGQTRVTDLIPGQVVWTLSADGQRVAVPVLVIASTPAPPGHQVVDLRLADGREVLASPGHPLSDGRPVGTLRLGDQVNGSVVVSSAFIPYTGSQTWDLLPAGGTGVYWADGVPLGSTLRSGSSATTSNQMTSTS